MKTYGKEVLAPIKDVIDMESAMREFFEGIGQEWKPLFRSMIDEADAKANNDQDGDNVPAISWLNEIDTTNFEFHETSSPWKRLDAVPTAESDREVLATFLDRVQASLIEIPVDETTQEDDENDLHFLEEGRRMLVCSRFHVVGEEDGTVNSSGSFSRIERSDRLFATCWNEICHLQDANEPDTGSMILVPGSDLEDLRRFTDMNLQRPLQWLGLDGNFEVASMQHDSPGIRLIHKLSEMPTDLPEEPERMGDAEDSSEEDS